LPLLTVRDYLLAPRRYDPESSWRSAIALLAGGDNSARAALTAQAAEWGGWVGDAGYQFIDESRPEGMADALGEPAISESRRLARELYRGRIAALAGLADRCFREELLEVMSRRLAVARAFPLAQDYIAATGPDERQRLLGEIASLRASLDPLSGAKHAVDLFL